MSWVLGSSSAPYDDGSMSGPPEITKPSNARMTSGTPSSGGRMTGIPPDSIIAVAYVDGTTVASMSQGPHLVSLVGPVTPMIGRVMCDGGSGPPMN